MVRKPQQNFPVRLDALTHARLKLASQKSQPRSEMNAIAIHAITIYLKQHFPEVLTEIVTVPEQSAPASEPASLQKAAPRARKKK